MIQTNVQCCLCAENIISDNINPCDIVMGSNWDKREGKKNDQFFWVHFECFKDKLHESVRPYLVLDILTQD